ncbi:hypothetical protein AC564_0080c [Lacticaseibacillus paracasei]|nr:hypothetical protein AC564_0080c [Lacticaseibacillus paracasei]
MNLKNQIIAQNDATNAVLGSMLKTPTTYPNPQTVSKSS